MNLRELGRVPFEKAYQGVPCKHGHSAVRYKSDNSCIACIRKRKREQAQLRRRGEALPVNFCEICGTLLRGDCKSGVCYTTPECRRERDRRNSAQWARQNYVRGRFFQIRARARKRGTPFTLTLEDIPPIPEFCPIFGTRLSRSAGARAGDLPSLDRIDSTKGYVKGNVAWISRRANTIKNDATAEEHMRIAEWMQEMEHAA